MKKVILVIIFFSVIFVFLSSLNKEDNADKEIKFSNPRSGTAIIMTGAAARISQQAALLEELDKNGL